MATINIYEYLDYREFMNDWFTAKAGRPSQRGFARKIGCAQALPSMIIKGQRDLSAEWVERFARGLKLDKEATRYLLDLLQFNDSGSALLKKEAWQRIRVRRRFRTGKRITEHTYALYAHWYYAAIAELARCHDWKDDPVWIARTLRPQIAVPQAREALKTLETLKLLVRDEFGQLVSNGDVWTTDHEVEQSEVSLGILKSTHWSLGRAAEAIQVYSETERHYEMVTLSCPASHIEEMKALISKFQEEMIQLCTDPDNADRNEMVYQLGVQLFPLRTPK